MRKNLGPLALLSLSVALAAPACAQRQPIRQPIVQPVGQPIMVEQGRYSIHMLLRTIGTEEYTVTDEGAGRSVLSLTSTSSDRGMKRSVASTLEMGPRVSPLRLEQTITTASGDTASLAELKGTAVSVKEGDASRTLKTPPPVAFMGFASMPASVQMMMMRYWKLHHEPARLPMLRASGQALPLEIKLVGHDAFSTPHGMVRLTRYTVANLMFGREVLWMNSDGRLVALMTFAGGLPIEELRDDYEELGSQLVHSGVQQEMLDLDDLDRQVPAQATGAFAIAGARLIDGTGAPAIEDSVVIVRDGRIVAAGAAASTPIPPGMRVIHASGKSLLPGLWEMHTHYSGVEFGPALLAAGVTTARDCGGEFEFLTTLRSKIDTQHALGPKLLLAGLIDSGGPLGFGYVDVKTPADAVAAVDTYADAKFNQIKVYTQIQPDVLRAISAEAHRRGLTVTGHVPAAINAFDGVADGMDQINHLQFVTRAMLPDGDSGPVDLASDRAQRLIALLKERHIVVDPTDGWGEMASHPKNLDVASFEPGIKAAPYTLASKFRSMGSPAADAAKFHDRMETNRKVIHALYQAGVTIIPGSDTGLLGYGLDRELELYVQAGMTPMQAIESATIVPARVMKLDQDSGSVEAGKRADLLLVDGDPLENISDLRRVVSVVQNGRLYDSKLLARSVGFRR
ncbi:MAG TPA: amidohydrolase family protein [Granulicella sp.]|jgi:imidazolonepropionase-like amidohydrolase|nr:amidohydrolase family protein [Granulicella sp.]